VFAANPDFPAALGGPPALERFIVSSWTSRRPSSPRSRRAKWTSPVSSPRTPRSSARTRRLTVLDYPVIMP